MDIIIYKLVLSLLLGAFIGIERQLHDTQERNKNYLGLRTFALVTALGAISGFIGLHIPSLFLLLTAGTLVLIICYYIFDSLQTKDYGFTTEVTLFFSYVIGILIAHDIFPSQLIIGMTVVLVLVLSQKERLRSYITLIKADELQSFIRYAVIALVILPLLPNVSYYLADIPYSTELLHALNLPASLLHSIELVNPFQLWLVVALITGIDIVGYILGRVFGHAKGWFLTSFVGGFISSTATTQSLAQQSKLNKNTYIFVVAAIAATLASFLEHAVLILPLNILLFMRILPILVLMALTSGLLIYYFNRKNKGIKQKYTADTFRKKELFHLAPAIKFALLFVLIKFISALALQLFGDSGYFLALGFGAIPGMDAVLITIAQTAGKAITFPIALYAFIIANAVNILVKCLLAFTQGERKFAIQFSISAGIILFIGFLGVLFQSVVW